MDLTYILKANLTFLQGWPGGYSTGRVSLPRRILTAVPLPGSDSTRMSWDRRVKILRHR